MTTRFTLNVSKDEMDPQSGHGVQQNATVTSDNPEDLIAALTQLAGVNTAKNNYGAQAVVATGDCGCGDMEGVKEEDYANTPSEKTYGAPGGVGDLVDTGHTARAKNHYTKAGFGDNPLAETDDEEEDEWYDKDGRPDPNGAFDAGGHFHAEREADRHYEESVEQKLSSMLMREWTETKLQAVSEEFDTGAAIAAITEGKTEYVKGSKKFAVRLEESVAKVYPIMENRTLMTMPLFVIDTASLVKESEAPAAPAVNEGSREGVINSITRRIMMQHTDVLAKFGPVRVMAAIEDRAANLDDLEEIGSSDVSIWTKDVIDSLESGYFNDADDVPVREAKKDHDSKEEAVPDEVVKKAAEIKKDMKEDVVAEGTMAHGIFDRNGKKAKEAIDKLESMEMLIASGAGDKLYDLVFDDQLFDIIDAEAEENPSSNLMQNSAFKKRLSHLLKWAKEEVAGEGLEEGDFVGTLGAIAAARYQPKVGDKIRTRKGGQIPGTVEKVGEVSGIEYCWFRHPDGKLFKTPCSNVMREEVEMAEDNTNIEVSEELADILALAGMHEAKVAEDDIEENAYVQAAAAAARSGAKEFEFPKGSGKMHPVKMDKGTAHQMGEGKKPDFLDVDGDGDKKEPMAKAAKDKEEKVDEATCSVCNEDPCCCEDKKMDESSADVDYIKSLLAHWK